MALSTKSLTTTSSESGLRFYKERWYSLFIPCQRIKYRSTYSSHGRAQLQYQLRIGSSINDSKHFHASSSYVVGCNYGMVILVYTNSTAVLCLVWGGAYWRKYLRGCACPSGFFPSTSRSLLFDFSSTTPLLPSKFPSTHLCICLSYISISFCFLSTCESRFPVSWDFPFWQDARLPLSPTSKSRHVIPLLYITLDRWIC